MTTIQWIWMLCCMVNIIAIGIAWWKLYDEQPNDLAHHIISALIVVAGPIGTYFLFIVGSLGYGLVIFCGAMQGLGYSGQKEPDKEK